MIYALVEAEKANHSVGALCRVLKVSKSGYYGWRHRPPSARTRADAALAEKIERAHRDSRGIYGAPRVHAELRSLGVRCGRKRVLEQGAIETALQQLQSSQRRSIERNTQLLPHSNVGSSTHESAQRRSLR